MTDPAYDDPIVRALVEGGARLGPLPHMGKVEPHPLVKALADKTADLRDGIVSEQIAERDAGGHILRTRTRQTTPQMLIAQGNDIIGQITAAHKDMSDDEWIGAVIAAHEFCKAVAPYSKSPQRWARVAKSLADALTLDGVRVVPPLT